MAYWLASVTMNTEQEDAIIGEISQAEKDKSQMVSLI
jgi:hypothetical protein